MGKTSERRLLRVWLLLCAITLVTWFLGSEHRASGGEMSALVTYSALAVAAVKVRVIVVEFMEPRRVSKRLLFMMDAWLLLLAVSLSAIYAFKLDMAAV